MERIRSYMIHAVIATRSHPATCIASTQEKKLLRGGARHLQKVITAKDFQFGGPLAPSIIVLPKGPPPKVITAKDFQFGGPLAPFIVVLPEGPPPKILTAKDFQIGGPLAPSIIALP